MKIKVKKEREDPAYYTLPLYDSSPTIKHILRIGLILCCTWILSVLGEVVE